MQQIQWRDRFNIGVELIDHAHRQLFSIVQKIMDLYVERHEDKFACVEGIKYFKAYALQHFAEEEAYMREIGYHDYLVHKKAHDKMRYETLPELERLLYDSDFSTEMVQRFIGVCTGWLTGHILMEDQAIIGGRNNKSASIPLDDGLSAIQAVIISPLQELLGCQLQFIGSYSTKDLILNEQDYELIYRSQEGDRLQVVLAIGQQTLLYVAGLMLGMNFYEKNDIVRFAIQEMAQNLIQRASVGLGQHPDKFHLETSRFLKHEEFAKLFQERAPQHSLLFRVEHEIFALCINLNASSDFPGS